MPTTLSLPDKASLEHVRGQARTLQRAVRAADPAALRRAAAVLPDTAPAGFPLSSAQLVVAREYGFPSWPKLRAHFAVIDEYRWETTEPVDGESTADRFCRLACLNYTDDDPAHRTAAAALLAEHPDLPAEHLWAAAAAAAPDAVRGHLARGPVARGGPYRWTPLFYLLYSRLPGVSTAAALEVARLLLSAGADPNEGYLWHGLTTPFTLLTGAFGEGEQGRERQPRHPAALALAELLLTAGADPNDGQALYNRMFGRDDDHLRLLLAHGLGHGDGGPWRARLTTAVSTPAELLQSQFNWAVTHDQADRVRLLLPHVDPTAPLATGRTPLRTARYHGSTSVAALLEPVTSHDPDPTPAEALIGAALAADHAQVAEIRAAHPAALAEARTSRPGLIVWATALNRPEAVTLLLELGFDVNAQARGDIPSDQPWQTALHQAVADDNPDLVTQLLTHGADPTVTDARFHATPEAWARHLNHPELLPLFEE